MKKCAKIILLFLLAALLTKIDAQTLIFKSGFEPGTRGTPATDHKEIIGTDNSTGYSWTNDLEGHSKIGDFFFDYTGGDYTGRFGKIIDEPNNPGNKVLHFWCNTPNASNGNARVQNNLYDNKNLKEFYQKIKLYLHPDLEVLTESNDSWTFFTIAEFWNNSNWRGEKYPFRISLNFHKKAQAGRPLSFYVHAQTDLEPGWREEWQVYDHWEIPFGQWLTCELYIKEGDENTGRFYFAVTPEGGDKEVIYDITNITHHPDDPAPNGFAHWNPMKMYTSKSRVNTVVAAGKALQLYWDDWELWEGGFPTSVEEPKVKHPEAFFLKQNYPNPFNPSTTIEYSIEKNEFVTLKIYDVNGRVVDTLVNQQHVAGTHSIVWTPNDIPSGVYLYELTTGTRLTAKKLILMN